MENRSDFYREKGYFVAPGLVTQDELEELKSETLAIFRGKYEVEGIVRRSATANEDEVLRNYLCIHQPHKISEVMARFIRHRGIIEHLTEWIGPNVKCMQSMLFVKPPGFPGQAWHQDEYYIPTVDRSLTGAWIAIDDATIENGCLWVVPESHRGELHRVGPQPKTEEYDGIGNIALDVAVNEAIPVEVEKGSVVFFNGYLLHESRKNRTKRYRRALVSHYMSADYPLVWGGKDDYRDVVLVAGEDPFADRGYEDISKPWLRPTKAATGADA